jgi:predicted enzyme related to lactoylglutathione lyase
MGQPVVHFEVIGKDGEALQKFYGELFDWEFNTDNEQKYGLVDREANLNEDGWGIAGGVAKGPDGYDGHVTFYVEVDDIGATLDKAESLGGSKVFGPDEVFPGLMLGQFTDAEGHLIGLVTRSDQD